MYRASDAKLKASPRRSGGARSTFALRAPTKNSASPTPVRSRIATRSGIEVATRYPTTETAKVEPPATMRIRRP